MIKTESIYTDSQGYPRFKDNNRLVHRAVAEKNIWKKDRKKYPLPFEDYQVHHIDGKKNNYRISNLEILTKREHESKHNYVRVESLVIKALFILFCTMGVLNIAGFIMNDYILSQNTRLLISLIIIFLAFLIIYLTTKIKKNQRVI